jgi:hypothetical protein
MTSKATIIGRIFLRAIAAAAFVIGSVWLLAQPALAESRVALVIGNGAYEKVPELPNPPRDATDIGHALERLNFKVTLLKNATAQEMRKAVVDFGRTAEGSEMAVVFYAGHGIEVAGENWLIPVSAELRSDADVESEAISLRSVSLQVSKARQLGLVILDACRNNPFAAKMKRSISTRAVARGLAPTEPADNVLIAYSARDGTTASDGEGQNSPFTTALLHHIETPGLEISFLFRRVRDDVMAATKREQQPFVYGSLSKEEIYLKAPAVNASVGPAADSVASAPTEDERFWQAIQTSTVVGLFEEYLSRYSRGGHVTEARQRIKDLNAKQVVAASAATASSQPESAANPIKGGESSGAKPSDRNLYTADDARKVAAIGTAQQLIIPTFSIDPTASDNQNSYAKFVGVWSSKAGWGKGKGRHAMVIILEVSATGLARGYYLWGPPTKQSWVQDTAGNKYFTGYIVNDKFSIGVSPVIQAELDSKNVLTLSVSKSDKPAERAGIELRPLWQLVQVGEDPEPSKREHTSRLEHSTRQDIAPKRDALDRSRTPTTASGSTMEERYRACKKLVNGFARREACARTGSI